MICFNLYYFHHALLLLLKEENLSIEDIDDLRPWLHQLVGDIEDSIVTWFHQCDILLNTDNWTDKTKKPEINLYMEITVKGNFKLEWYPVNRNDFISFNDWSYGCYEPLNRIVFIHEVQNMMWIDREKNINSMIMFSEAIEKHIQTIIKTLSKFVIVHLKSNIICSDKRPYFKVVSMEEFENIKKENWMNNTFKNLNIDPIKFIELYKESGKNVKKLKKMYIFPQKIGEISLQNIIDTIKKDFPSIYEKI